MPKKIGVCRTVRTAFDRQGNGYRADSSIKENSGHPEESIDITVAYMDTYGNFKTRKVKSRDLSSSWVWENSVDGVHAQSKAGLVRKEGSYQQTVNSLQENDRPSTNQNQGPGFISPRQRQKRREKRIAELVYMSKETELQMEAVAIERTKKFNHRVKGKYSIWRKEYQPTISDSTLKLMKDQIIMAEVYASIALSLKKLHIYDSLMKRVKESQLTTEVATSDADLHSRALEQAKDMSDALNQAKEVLYDCDVVARKLQAMVQSTEENINGVKKQSTFLIQHVAKTIPKPLHCLSFTSCY